MTQTLALLPHHLIFGRIPKSLDTAGSTFLSFSSEPNITHTHTHTRTHIYIYIEKATKEATEMVAKYLDNKKMCL